MRFAKGHGTQNDFVVLPDLDGELDLLHVGEVAPVEREDPGAAGDPGLAQLVEHRFQVGGIEIAQDDLAPCGRGGHQQRGPEPLDQRGQPVLITLTTVLCTSLGPSA